MNDNEIVEAIKELMDVWNRLMAEARAMLPDATPEESFLRGHSDGPLH